MHVDPSIMSPTRKFSMSLDRDTTMSSRVDPTARIPIMSLIWDTTMSMATADVNPAFTGPEMKSIKNPVYEISGIIFDEKYIYWNCLRIVRIIHVYTGIPNPTTPMISWMNPVKKHSRVPYTGPNPLSVLYVISDTMAVGPMGTSLQVPRKTYIILPMNEPYRPYCKKADYIGHRLW